MATTYPLQSQKRFLGGLLTYVAPAYNFASASGGVKNGSGSPVDILDPAGYPVKSDGSGGYSLAFSGDEGSVIGLIIWEAELAITNALYSTVGPIPILVRGPAVIDSTYLLPALDAAGANFTIATIITTLAALSPPIISKTEPTINATQTS